MIYALLRSLKALLVLTILFLFLPGSNSFAQEGSPSYVILGISVEGNKSADAQTIIANSGLAVGEEIQIPSDKTIQAIRRLWALNFLSDIQLIIEKQVQDGVFLLIKVEEYPRFEEAVIRGNDEIGEDDIYDKINIIRGQILRPQKVNTITMDILELYKEDGFLNAEVKAHFFEYAAVDTTEDEIIVTWRNPADFSDEYIKEYEKDEVRYNDLIEKIEGRILLIFDIDEGDESSVRKITFFGNEAFEDDDLADAMEETSEGTWWEFWSGDEFNPELFEEDKKLIEQFYRKNGYRDAEVIADSVFYSDNNEEIDLQIYVYEGPQYHIREIDWIGNTVYSDDFLSTRLGLNKGDIYDYEKFQMNLRGNEQQSDIASLYLDNGYLTFQVQESEQRVEGDSVDLEIQVSERNQFRIGNVTIEGNDKTKDKVIRRELYTVPGDYFNRAALLRSLQQLANLQFFNVEKLYQKGVDYRIVNDSTVNTTFIVEEKSSDYLNASIGYSGAFGFSGAVGVTLTNFSIAEPFSLGGGQILSFNWQFGVGNLYRTFSLGFTEPWLFDTPTLVGFEFFDTRQQYVYDLSQTGGTVKVGRRLRWPDDYFYVQGMLKYQHNNVIDGGSFYVEGVSEQYTVGASISRKNVDNPIFPSQGSSVGLNFELSGGPFLPGNVDYYKLQFNAEWYRRLFNSSKLTLYTGATLGYLDELVDGTPINPFEYFYMGGSGLIIATTSLRGYEDRTVGPRNNFGDVIGGRVMARYVAELRYAVSLDPIPLYLLAFAEAGRVFETIKTTELFNLRRSVGFGARIMINPIGLIGFDLGYGFDRRVVDGDEPSWKFHFQFGKGF